VNLVTSRQNPKFKRLRANLKGSTVDGIMPVEGPKLIDQALAGGLEAREVWTTGERAQGLEHVVHYRVPEDMYRQLSPTRSGRPPLAIFQQPTLRTMCASTGRWMLLDQVQDPGNAGALVRAAAGFGLDGVALRRPCVHPFHHACIRGSAGSVFRIPLLEWPTKDDELPSLDLVGAVSRGGTELDRFQWPDNFVLVLGNEGHGLSDEIAGRVRHQIRIPTLDRVESLNVTGAAHILLYHFARQRP